MPLTTFEMDGLFTQEDIDNRHKTMKYCLNCKQWTLDEGEYGFARKCENCKEGKFDLKQTCSLRTFNPKGKKITRWEEKKLGL